MVFVAGKTVWSMPEPFKVVCIPCKALYKCSAFARLLPLNETMSVSEPPQRKTWLRYKPSSTSSESHSDGEYPDNRSCVPTPRKWRHRGRSCQRTTRSGSSATAGSCTPEGLECNRRAPVKTPSPSRRRREDHRRRRRRWLYWRTARLLRLADDYRTNGKHRRRQRGRFVMTLLHTTKQ